MATALPTAASFTGSTVTEAQFKSAMTDMRTFLADLLGTDGTEATALAAIGALFGTRVTKTGAYTVVASDLGKTIDCTSGTFSVTTPASATVGAGFNFVLRNSGTGVITLDGNGSETIDGETTIELDQHETKFVCADGTNWYTAGGSSLKTKVYEFENSGSNISTSTSASSAIDTQTINIPTAGIIKVKSAALRFSNGTSLSILRFGIRIGSNTYNFNDQTDLGWVRADASTVYTSTGAPRNSNTQVQGPAQLVLDIESSGLAGAGDTGSKSVELYAIQSAGTGTLQNTTTTFRATLEVVDNT